jgi:hypothetical protein
MYFILIYVMPPRFNFMGYRLRTASRGNVPGNVKHFCLYFLLFVVSVSFGNVVIDVLVSWYGFVAYRTSTAASQIPVNGHVERTVVTEPGYRRQHVESTSKATHHPPTYRLCLYGKTVQQLRFC